MQIPELSSYKYELCKGLRRHLMVEHPYAQTIQASILVDRLATGQKNNSDVTDDDGIV